MPQDGDGADGAGQPGGPDAELPKTGTETTVIAALGAVLVGLGFGIRRLAAHPA